jgi:hypothetical protein
MTTIRRRRPLALAAMLTGLLLVAGLATAQDVRFAVSFEEMDGRPAAVEEVASGDVKVLRVEVRNDSDATLEPGGFWVAFPPVEGATLFGNAGNGFSLPDRMLDAEGDDVMVDFGVHEYTQLHALPEALAPGDVGEIALQVTVLSSRNTVAEAMSETYLVGPGDETLGVRDDASAMP